MATRTRPRRSRRKRGEGELLRKEILRATERLLLQTGDADAVSIRAVAEAVGVTPPSIYMHFANKDELILQVCEEGFAALQEAMEEALASATDPVEAVKAMGRAYIHFGLEHPEQYRVLFMVRAPEKPEEGIVERALELSGFGVVVAAVQRCLDEGRFRGDDAFKIACGLWAGVHGITSLVISKPGFPWPDLDGLVEHSVGAYCEGLRA